MTITQQLEIIATTLSKVETISADNADRLLNLLDRAPQDALQMLVDRKVKFCWMPAKRRLADKFGVK
jgi:hypothetical protein